MLSNHVNFFYIYCNIKKNNNLSKFFTSKEIEVLISDFLIHRRVNNLFNNFGTYLTLSL